MLNIEALGHFVVFEKLANVFIVFIILLKHFKLKLSQKSTWILTTKYSSCNAKKLSINQLGILSFRRTDTPLKFAWTKIARSTHFRSFAKRRHFCRFLSAISLKIGKNWLTLVVHHFSNKFRHLVFVIVVFLRLFKRRKLAFYMSIFAWQNAEFLWNRYYFYRYIPKIQKRDLE